MRFKYGQLLKLKQPTPTPHYHRRDTTWKMIEALGGAVPKEPELMRYRRKYK